MDGGVADPEDPALQCASDAQLAVLLAPPEEIVVVLDDLEERFGTVANWLEREAGFGAGGAQNLQSNTLTPLFGELVAWQWSLLLDSAGAATLLTARRWRCRDLAVLRGRLLRPDGAPSTTTRAV